MIEKFDLEVYGLMSVNYSLEWVRMNNIMELLLAQAIVMYDAENKIWGWGVYGYSGKERTLEAAKRAAEDQCYELI